MKKTILILLLIIFVTTSSSPVYANATSTEDQRVISVDVIEVLDENSEEGYDVSTSTQEFNKKDSLQATSTQETSTTTIATTTATTTDDESDEVDKVKIFIKNKSEIIFEDYIEISNDFVEIEDSDSNTYDIRNNNVLAVLNSSDLESDSFTISDLQYYPDFESFLLNCINIETENLCYDWQYVVNDEYPSEGMDKKEVSNGDVIYIYFGQPKRIITPTTAVKNIEFPVISEEYNYKNNTWGNLSGYTVGIFTPDPEKWWVAIEIATSTIGSFGESYFTIGNEGDYKIGIKEDGYYPQFDINIASTTLVISTSTATTTDSDSDAGSNPGGGSNGSSPKFDIDDAIEFLLNNQKYDGSFGSDLYSDWAAVAFSSVGENNNSLEKYIEDGSVSSDLYEILRKTMALLALDLDPQKDFGENLVESILGDFDGEQFGDVDFFNDDIFALIVLQKIGFDEGDDEISKTIDFILSKQSNSGAFEGVDITSAAIQALYNFDDYPGVSVALSDAENYLRDSQSTDGDWDNVYSTSWAMMAMSALGYDFDDWKGDPLEYLGEEQENDGGLLKEDTDNNRVWSTSYAISAASEKTWIDILDDFSFVVAGEDSSQDGGGSSSSNDSSDVIEEGANSIPDDITAGELINQNIEKILEYLENNKKDRPLKKEIDFTLVGEKTNFIEDEDEDEIEEYLEKEMDNFSVEENEIIKKQTATVINSLDFAGWIYLILAIVAFIISVIMFKRK